MNGLAHAVRPPAARARRTALVLSIVAVLFSLGFGVFLRRMLVAARSDDPDPDAYAAPLVTALVFLLIALLLRMLASICELLWLERTWSNLPEELRRVGPVEKVTPGLVIGLSFVPGLAWIWKLGLVTGIANGFEKVRERVPFVAPVPKRLAIAAVVIGWIPGLNVYIAPFLWEMFATRMDVVCNELLLGYGGRPPPPR